MDRTTYEVEARVERDHWWFRGRRRILARLIDALGLPDGALALDVGCGTGANGPVLAQRTHFTVGLDASAIPLDVAARGHGARIRGDALHLPFADGTFDLVVALDVLEHLDDDFAAGRELRRVTRPGGALIAFVPALRILWGLQDQVSHHRRRYTRTRLRSVVEQGGFGDLRITYFNTLLFPPILAARLAMRIRPPKISTENELGGPLVNKLFGAIFAVEAPLLERFDLPIGVSLACVARAT